MPNPGPESRTASAPGAASGLPVVISPERGPLTLYTRPQRTGSTERFEPGDGLVRNLIQSERFHVGIWEALPGESFWIDCHPVDEFLYVIEGVATILVPSLRQAVQAHQGDVVHMPARTDHQTMNRGPGTLKLLFCAPPDAIST